MSNDEVLAELQEIRKLLTPPEPKPPPDNLLEEFKEFLKKYKVIGLAVAFILALYLGQLVSSLVNYIIMPLVSLIVPDLSTEEGIVIYLTSLGKDGPTIFISLFLGSLITFLIMAFVMFMLVKLTTKMGLE